MATALDAPGIVFSGTARRVSKSSTGGNFWTPVLTRSLGGPILFGPTNATVYAFDYSGAGSRSFDGGVTWRDLRFSGFPSEPALFALFAVSPTDRSLLYAVASDLLGPIDSKADGIYRSDDAGDTWSKIGAGVRLPTSIVIDPATPTIMYIGDATRGVFKSMDGGLTWRSANVGLADLQVTALVIDRRAPTTLYAATLGRGAFKTTTGGDEWVDTSLGVGLLALVLGPTDSSFLYGMNDTQAFRSRDGGSTWAPAGSLPPGFLNWPSFFHPLSPPLTAGRASDGSSSLYLGTSAGTFRSLDAGSSWLRVTAGLADSDAVSVAINPRSPSTVYAAIINDGVHKSTDGGGSWRRTATSQQFVSAVVIDPQQTDIIYSCGDDILKSVNGGQSWSAPLPGVSFCTSLVIDHQSPSTLYAVTFDGVVKSQDGGASWRASNLGLTSLAVSKVAIDPRQPGTLFAVTNDGLFKTTDGAGRWRRSDVGIDLTIFSLAIDPLTTSTIYAGGTQTTGFFEQTAGVFKSVDGGSRWALAGSLPGFAGTLAINPRTPNVLYAATFNEVFQSLNGGDSWASLNGGLDSRVVAELAISPSGMCLHAATEGGVFDFAVTPNAECLAPPTLASAILPTSRSVAVGTPAVAFATIIASERGPGAAPFTSAVAGVGQGAGMTCGITQLTGVPTSFTFQATDPQTNQPIGTPNTPVNIPPGSSQTFLISLTPRESFCATNVAFDFSCANADSAPAIVGVNTLLMSASQTVVPDVIALSATSTNDGIVNLHGPNGAAAFAVASANVGSAGIITVSADTGDSSVPVVLSLCETDSSGACKDTPAPSVTRRAEASETPTFTVFVNGQGLIPFDPANSRVFVRFNEDATCDGRTGAVTRGSTSVAVRTQ